MTDRAEKWITSALLWVGIIGFVVSFPLWLANKVSDHAMLGMALVLSWAALWYAAFLALQNARQTRELVSRLDEVLGLLKD